MSIYFSFFKCTALESAKKLEHCKMFFFLPNAFQYLILAFHLRTEALAAWKPEGDLRRRLWHTCDPVIGAGGYAGPFPKDSSAQSGSFGHDVFRIFDSWIVVEGIQAHKQLGMVTNQTICWLFSVQILYQILHVSVQFTVILSRQPSHKRARGGMPHTDQLGKWKCFPVRNGHISRIQKEG